MKMISGRIDDFNEIKDCMARHAVYSDSDIVILEGDSLKLLQEMPSKKISLLLTDPPYHSTKKDNILGDTDFSSDADFVSWMNSYAQNWSRVIRENGSGFVFCAAEMAARLEVCFSSTFNILSHIVWTKPNEPGFDGWKQKMKKEALRQWYEHTERVIFFEQACEGNLRKSTFANFLREQRLKAGITGNKLTEMTGAYGSVNHGGAVSNWETGRNIPSREQYQKICDAFIQTGKIESMPAYEDVIRPFSVNGDIEFTDVWNFQNVRPYKGKHPAEKPQDLLQHAILATSFENDIVMDCFGGSGSTAIAAVSCGRKAVLIERDPKWIEFSVNAMHEYRKKGIPPKVNSLKAISQQKQMDLALALE